VDPLALGTTNTFYSNTYVNSGKEDLKENKESDAKGEDRLEDLENIF